MRRIFSLLLALSLYALPVYAVDFAVVQSAAPTTAIDQDFTVAGFGTPKCALFWTIGPPNDPPY